MYSIRQSECKLLSILLFIVVGAASCCFGQNQINSAKNVTLLNAGDLSLKIGVTNHHFEGVRVRAGFLHRPIDIRESFVIVLKDKTVLRSTDMQVTPASNSIVATDPHRSLRISNDDALSSTSSCWNFTAAQFPADFQWCVIVRAGSSYARQLLSITATAQDLPITEIRLLHFADSSAHVEGHS